MSKTVPAFKKVSGAVLLYTNIPPKNKGGLLSMGTERGERI